MQPVAGAGPSLAGPCRSGVASFFTLDTRSIKKEVEVCNLPQGEAGLLHADYNRPEEFPLAAFSPSASTSGH